MARLKVSAVTAALAIGAASPYTYTFNKADYWSPKQKENWQGNGKRKKPKGR